MIKYLVFFSLFHLPLLAYSKETFQIELVRQTHYGTERNIFIIDQKKSEVALTSNMLSSGEEIGLGSFKRNNKIDYKDFSTLYKKLDLEEGKNVRKKKSPHIVEIWVNEKPIYPQTTAYKRIKTFSSELLKKAGWKPIDAQIFTFSKNGQVQVQSYRSERKKSVELQHSAEICKLKSSDYICQVDLGIIYAPKWARRLPGTIN